MNFMCNIKGIQQIYQTLDFRQWRDIGPANKHFRFNKFSDEFPLKFPK